MAEDKDEVIEAIVEDYGTAKYKPMIAPLLKNSPLVLPK